MLFRRWVKFIPGLVKKVLLIAIMLGFLAGFFVGLFGMEYYDGNEKIASIIYKRYPSLAFLTRSYRILDILYFWDVFMPRKLPVYELTINKADLKKLEKNLPSLAEESWGGGDLKKNEVGGILKCGDREYKVTVRFRGDSQIHWAYPKKSWRVKIDNNELESKGLINGMSEFNFIVAEDRSFIVEQLNNYRAGKLGLLTPYSEFVDLKLNGRGQGAYYLVEQWSPDFLERNNVKADINLYGEEAFRGLVNENIYTYLENWRKYTQDNYYSFDNFAEMDKLLSLIREADDETFWREISNLIDLNSFYAWNTQAILAGSDHQDYAHNLRIYFDNSYGKFRFIPWEVNQAERGGFYDYYVSPLIDRILKNPEFLAGRNQVLWNYVKDEDNLADDLDFYNSTLKKVKPSYYKDNLKSCSNLYFDRMITNHRRILIGHYKEIQDKLKESFVSVEARFNFGGDGKTTRLDFLSRNYSPLEIRGIEFNSENQVKAKLYWDKNKNGFFDAADVLTDTFKQKDKNTYFASSSVIIAGQRRWEEFTIENYDQPVEIDYAKESFFVVSDQPDFILEKLDPKVANVFTEEAAEFLVHYVDEATFKNFSEIGQSVDQFLLKQTAFKRSGNGLVLPIGSYNFNSDIIIPEGTSLTISAGTVLTMGPGASIIAYSPIKILGETERPVVFTASNKNQPWGVLGLTQGAGSSVIKNAIFEYGKDDYINGIYFSGMASVYFAKVEIDGCTFRYARADDGLNVKNADGEIRNSLFYRNSADGFDIDFNSSLVENNRFIENGNDGLDVSGSRSLIYKNLMSGNGDKGISIGENSAPIIINNLIQKNNIGLEIKDLSQPKIINCTAINNEIGINSYRKKIIFGGGDGEVYNSIVWGNKETVKLDEHSKIKIETSNIEGGYAGQGNVNLDPKFDANFKTKDENLKAKAEIIKEYRDDAPAKLLMGIY